MPDKRMISSGAFESEIALIIKDNADHMRKELAGIHHILEYQLEPKPSQIIHDTYYDTKEQSLQERKITLRTRRIDHTLLISTKSDIRIISRNIIQRREMERPWSYDAIRLLARNLKLKIPVVPVSQLQSFPVAMALATMGLDVIQERQTEREARYILTGGKTRSSVLAELAIDHVTYTFDNIKVRLSEIEIEAKATTSFSTIRKIADVLVSKYQPALQQWFHGKFVTGLAIRRLLETGDMLNYLENADLGSGAFELIDRTIRSRRF